MKCKGVLNMSRLIPSKTTIIIGDKGKIKDSRMRGQNLCAKEYTYSHVETICSGSRSQG